MPKRPYVSQRAYNRWQVAYTLLRNEKLVVSYTDCESIVLYMNSSMCTIDCNLYNYYEYTLYVILIFPIRNTLVVDFRQKRSH